MHELEDRFLGGSYRATSSSQQLTGLHVGSGGEAEQQLVDGDGGVDEDDPLEAAEGAAEVEVGRLNLLLSTLLVLRK